MKKGLQNGSMAWRIAQLRPGECYSRAERVDQAITPRELAARATRLSDILRPAAHRAAHLSDTPVIYTTETSVFLGYGGAFIVVAVVTRLPD